eukprot:4905662-Prymnesium_polylepis.1
MNAQSGSGSPRSPITFCDSAEKKACAIARRIGTARQLPPAKIRSVGDGSKAWATSGVRSSPTASGPSEKKTTRRARRSHVSRCMRQRVLWKRRAVMTPTTTCAMLSGRSSSAGERRTSARAAAAPRSGDGP